MRIEGLASARERCDDDVETELGFSAGGGGLAPRAARRLPTWAAAHGLMLERARVEPGMRVLDLGAGTGDQTFPLARRGGPLGSVLATDISAGMLGVLREDAAAAGLTNIETLVADAGGVELPPQSFDAAISANCLQFVPAVDEALVRVRRALKPGRWLAAVVFAERERNPYSGVPQMTILHIGGLGPPDPTEPGVFALGTPGRFEAMLGQAGFREIDVLPVPIEWAFPSRAALMEQLVASPNQTSLLNQLEATRRAEALATIEDDLRQFESADGVRIPVRLD